MKFKFLQYIVDFDNMYMYADFPLRLNHWAHGKYPHIKPNLNLINFTELKVIKGQLKVWNSEERKWVQSFVGDEPSKKLDAIYREWLAEKHLLLD